MAVIEKEPVFEYDPSSPELAFTNAKTGVVTFGKPFSRLDDLDQMLIKEHELAHFDVKGEANCDLRAVQKVASKTGEKPEYLIERIKRNLSKTPRNAKRIKELRKKVSQWKNGIFNNNKIYNYDPTSSRFER